MKKSSIYLLGAGFLVFGVMIGCAGQKNDKKESSVVGSPRGGAQPAKPTGSPTPRPDGTIPAPGDDKGGPSSTAGDGKATGSKCVATLSTNADDMMDEETAKLEDMKDGSDKKWVLGKVEVYGTSGKFESTENDTQLAGVSGKIQEALKPGQQVTNVGSISCAYSSKSNVDVPEYSVEIPYTISAKDGKILYTRKDTFSAQGGKKVVTTSLETSTGNIEKTDVAPSTDTVVKVTKKDGAYIIRWEHAKTAKVGNQEVRIVTLMRATYAQTK